MLSCVPFHPPFNDAQTSVGRGVPERSGQPRLVIPPLLVGRQYRYDGVHDDALIVHCAPPRYEICRAGGVLQRTCTAATVPRRDGGEEVRTRGPRTTV
jgi:hypothetical protein